jgi:hypothetical protein
MLTKKQYSDLADLLDTKPGDAEIHDDLPTLRSIARQALINFQQHRFAEFAVLRDYTDALERAISDVSINDKRLRTYVETEIAPALAAKRFKSDKPLLSDDAIDSMNIVLKPQQSDSREVWIHKASALETYNTYLALNAELEEVSAVSMPLVQKRIDEIVPSLIRLLGALAELQPESRAQLDSAIEAVTPKRTIVG